MAATARPRPHHQHTACRALRPPTHSCGGGLWRGTVTNRTWQRVTGRDTRCARAPRKRESQAHGVGMVHLQGMRCFQADAPGMQPPDATCTVLSHAQYACTVPHALGFPHMSRPLGFSMPLWSHARLNGMTHPQQIVALPPQSRGPGPLSPAALFGTGTDIHCAQGAALQAGHIRHAMHKPAAPHSGRGLTAHAATAWLSPAGCTPDQAAQAAAWFLGHPFPKSHPLTAGTKYWKGVTFPLIPPPDPHALRIPPPLPS
jgi:hypothetical protein